MRISLYFGSAKTAAVLGHVRLNLSAGLSAIIYNIFLSQQISFNRLPAEQGELMSCYFLMASFCLRVLASSANRKVRLLACRVWHEKKGVITNKNSLSRSCSLGTTFQHFVGHGISHLVG